MFDSILKFFIENTKINYLLFFLIIAAGVVSYQKMPKEVFPSFDLDIVHINGGYSGASIDILDKVAVREIENEIKNISGIKEITSTIVPGSFNITAELAEGEDKTTILELVKDAVTSIKSNLPSDMNEPSVNSPRRTRDLLTISVSSKDLELSDLKKRANKLKDKLSSIKNVSGVDLFGDSE